MNWRSQSQWFPMIQTFSRSPMMASMGRRSRHRSALCFACSCRALCTGPYSGWVADLGVVQLIASKDEAIRANVAHQREHGLERGLVVFREMQIMRRDPALYFELRHWCSRL